MHASRCIHGLRRACARRSPRPPSISRALVIFDLLKPSRRRAMTSARPSRMLLSNSTAPSPEQVQSTPSHLFASEPDAMARRLPRDAPNDLEVQAPRQRVGSSRHGCSSTSSAATGTSVTLPFSSTPHPPRRPLALCSLALARRCDDFGRRCCRPQHRAVVRRILASKPDAMARRLTRDAPNELEVQSPRQCVGSSRPVGVLRRAPRQGDDCARELSRCLSAACPIRHAALS